MSPSWDEVNEAIPAYIGVGRDVKPSRHPELVVERFGAAKARELLPILKSIVDELLAIHVDRTKHNLDSATDLALTKIKIAHPELSPAALEAMDRLYSWLLR